MMADVTSVLHEIKSFDCLHLGLLEETGGYKGPRPRQFRFLPILLWKLVSNCNHLVINKSLFLKIKFIRMAKTLLICFFGDNYFF